MIIGRSLRWSRLLGVWLDIVGNLDGSIRIYDIFRARAIALNRFLFRQFERIVGDFGQEIVIFRQS